jgi:toxin ParE1/3/4
VADLSWRFHADAAAEFDASVAWYEARRPGLGLEFLDAVASRIADVTSNPHRWRIVRGTRRAPLRRFPFVVVFRETPDGSIEIVAVAHASRRPGFWTGR